MRTACQSAFVSFLLLYSVSVDSQEKGGDVGFWTFGNDKEWIAGKGGNLDNALAAFVQMKQKYGDQFQLIVEDLEQKGAKRPDGTETGKINIRIIVDPPDKEIVSQIEALGLIYVKE